MKIDLTRIFLICISSWVSVLCYSTSAPEDLDMSGDDLEYSGSGSGIGQDDVTINNGSIVIVTNATGNSWATDAAPVSVAQETTVKIAIGSVSPFPVTTPAPPAETSHSDAVPHHTTHVYSYEVMAGNNSTTATPNDTADTTNVPVNENVTTESGVNGASQSNEVVPTVHRTEESTTAPVMGSDEKVTVPTTTTTVVKTTMDSEEEVKDEIVSTAVTKFDETATVQEEIFDAVTSSDKTPAVSDGTTSAADMTSGWGGSDDEGVLNTSPNQYTDFNFNEGNIIPDVRRGVEKTKPDDDFAFDNEIGKTRVFETSAESQNILERKEVLAGVIAGGIVGVAFAVMLIALMAYRMKKKDEGSYALDDHKPTNGDYQIVRKQEEFLA